MIQALYGKWKDEDLAIVTVNLDKPETNVARFIAERELDFLVLIDPQQTVSRLYQVRYIPATFLIDRSGVVRDKVIGAFDSLEDIETRIKGITSD